MFQQKDFFIRMCEMEKLTALELQKLTKKSKSVVYEWLNYSNVNSYPSYESLSKIVCRLGISIDDLLKTKNYYIVFNDISLLHLEHNCFRLRYLLHVNFHLALCFFCFLLS